MIVTAVRATLLLALGIAILVTPVAEGTTPRNAAPANDASLQAELEGYISGLNGTYGVAAINLNDGSGVFVNEEMLFPTASMYKLLVMYRVYEAMESGSLSPEDTLTIASEDYIGGADAIFAPGDAVTVGSALEAMITQSSNAAAYALARAVGGWDVVISAAGELGMSNTVFDGDFFSTPTDMARFFRLLAGRSLVSPSASNQMIDLLLGQMTNDRIPALLPADAQVAHKTGELPGVRNDGGIVSGAGGRYIIVVMSQSGDPEEQVPAEAEISRMVYEAFGS
ncbi:MAG: serine hydrolase [Chloroflexota bacterium]|jgi:beta-lactamase class A